MSETTATSILQQVLVMNDLVKLHLPHQQTDGAFFVMEVVVAPGGGPPPLHTHPASEFFFTLEGELTYFRDDGRAGVTEVTGGSGTNAYIPGGVAHTYRNFTDRPGRYLAVLTPPEGMQEFLLEAGVEPGTAPLSPPEVLGIGERFGMVILDAVPQRATGA
jgi:mannose-6-phosphate isomerase-like protein (cupin superfamily)